ncbi:tandem-95 repeat protein, partial [Candidatus Peregrinibacteria bacterium]|nr:tandem-95 repeat protein [Candidatus Peregrinibacteria bacterium]
MKKSIEAKTYYQKLPNKKEIALIAGMAIAAPILDGCGGGGGETEEAGATGVTTKTISTEVIGSMIAGADSSISSIVSGKVCKEGEKTNNQGRVQFEIDTEKCPGPWQINTLGGVSDDTGLKQGAFSGIVQKGESGKLQSINKLTTTLVSSLKKGFKIEEIDRNYIMLAEMLGVEIGQLRQNYMEKGDDDFGEKLSAYVLLKNVLKTYIGKTEEEVDKMIISTMKERKARGQNIQLFKKGKAELFQLSEISSTTLLDDLLKECFTRSTNLSFESLEEQEQWKFFSIEIFKKILELNFNATDGVSREIHKKMVEVVSLLINETITKKISGDSEVTDIQLSGLQDWVSNGGILKASSGVFGHDISTVVKNKSENIISKQEEVLALSSKEMKFVKELIPNLDFQENPNASLEVAFVNLNKLGGDLSITGLPEGIAMKIGNSEDLSLYSSQISSFTEKMKISPKVKSFLLSFTFEKSYEEKKKEEGQFGNFTENIVLSFTEMNSETGENDEYTLNAKFIAFVPENKPPIIQSPDLVEIFEDANGAIDLILSDPDFDSTIISITQGENVQVSYDAESQKLNYVLSPNFNGEDRVVIRVEDKYGKAVEKTIIFSIAPVNDIPSVNVGTEYTINEDDSVSMTAIVSDIDSSVILTNIQTEPSNGFVAISGDTYTYTPNENFFGDDSFSLIYDDGNGGVLVKTFNTHVNGINDVPILNVASEITIQEDTMGNIEISISDVESTGLIPEVIQGDKGVAVYNSDTGNISYTPNFNSNGAHNFTIKVNDGEGGIVEKVISFNVTAVNDFPVLDDITDKEITWGEELNLSFVLNDIDSGSDDISISFASSNTDLLPNENIIKTSELILGEGNSSFSASVQYGFTLSPAAKQFGETTLTLRVSDGEAVVEKTFKVRVNFSGFTALGDEGIFTESEVAKLLPIQAKCGWRWWQPDCEVFAGAEFDYERDGKESLPGGFDYDLERIKAFSASEGIQNINSVKTCIIELGIHEHSYIDLDSELMGSMNIDEHGTAVAGVITKTIQAIQNSVVQPLLYPFKNTSFIQAIQDGCKVINLSQGAGTAVDFTPDLIAQIEATLQAQIDSGHDFLIVAGAGNVSDNTKNWQPFANLESVRDRIIIVSSLTYNEHFDNFS